MEVSEALRILVAVNNESGEPLTDLEAAALKYLGTEYRAGRLTTQEVVSFRNATSKHTNIGIGVKGGS